MAIINNTSKDVIDVYDVCIIGSGPAGMTLAYELVGSGKKVCVLESGSFKKQTYSDQLKKVESVGEIKIKDNSRERIVGGTSTTWGGGSAPMDNVDFSFRDFLSVPMGWPFSLKEIESYYKRTTKYGFPSYELFEGGLDANIKNSTEKDFLEINLDKKVFIAMDPPWNFGKKLLNIFENPGFDLYTDATVVELISEKDSEKEKISRVILVSSKGFKWSMKAGVFVLANGGIESVRLILSSKNTAGGVLGNKSNLLGKFIMNHPKSSFGVIKLKKPVYSLPLFFGYYFSGFAGFAGFRLDSKVQNEKKLLNSYVRFEPIFPWSDNIGVWSFLTIIKKLKTIVNFWKSKQKNIVHLRDYNETPDADGNAGFGWFRAFFDIIINIKAVLYYCIHRVLPGVSLPIHRIRLRNFMEMEPRIQNTITLSDIKDGNGFQIAKINLSTSLLDKKSLIALHRELKKELVERGIGDMEGELSEDDAWSINNDASHHIGGAIMGIEPNKSVVNSDLRLHDVSNLYVCSSSVFPTSGCANPTYTICALAIRLADKIKQ